MMESIFKVGQTLKVLGSLKAVSHLQAHGSIAGLMGLNTNINSFTVSFME